MIDNSWFERGDNPPIGWHGEATWGTKAVWHEVVILPDRKYALSRNNSWLINGFTDDLEFRPIKSERDKTIDAALNHDCKPNEGMLSCRDFCGKLYDAGLLRLPD